MLLTKDFKQKDWHFIEHKPHLNAVGASYLLQLQVLFLLD